MQCFCAIFRSLLLPHRTHTDAIPRSSCNWQLRFRWQILFILKRWYHIGRSSSSTLIDTEFFLSITRKRVSAMVLSNQYTHVFCRKDGSAHCPQPNCDLKKLIAFNRSRSFSFKIPLSVFRGNWIVAFTGIFSKNTFCTRDEGRETALSAEGYKNCAHASSRFDVVCVAFGTEKIRKRTLNMQLWVKNRFKHCDRKR